MKNKKNTTLLAGIFSILVLTACHSPPSPTSRAIKSQHSSQVLANSIAVIAQLNEYQQNWKGTRYLLGGTSRKGIDCSAFMQVTFHDLFGIKLPRTTVEQAKIGKKVPKNAIKTGDLVFFKTGRGPNGKHVGIYVDNGQFLHASTKGGVIYSNIHSPYWAKTFWQARRL
ncbi:MAG: NlpC/P60 family protein [Pasteurellaceae bacterium]|nr:NlpC/P60 family protein [Pasteurellaceae bacterium]